MKGIFFDFYIETDRIIYSIVGFLGFEGELRCMGTFICRGSYILRTLKLWNVKNPGIC